MQNAAADRECAAVNCSSIPVDASSDQSKRRAAEKKQFKTQASSQSASICSMIQPQHMKKM
jgi:hypothetical protein